MIDLSLPEEELLPKLAQATTEIGFMTVVGHSVDSQAMEAMFGESKRFFSLPQEVKDGYGQDGEHMCGYTILIKNIVRLLPTKRNQLY